MVLQETLVSNLLPKIDLVELNVALSSCFYPGLLYSYNTQGSGTCLALELFTGTSKSCVLVLLPVVLLRFSWLRPLETTACAEVHIHAVSP